MDSGCGWIVYGDALPWNGVGGGGSNGNGGIVPTRVTVEDGTIQMGDLLVTSSVAGSAMKERTAARSLRLPLEEHLDRWIREQV